jgi:hypothetical protein
MLYFLLLTKIGLNAQNSYTVNVLAIKLGGELPGITFCPTP